ncbi:MAG: pyrimidine 5'-nucleotidase [Pseudomonadota bacterium]
MAETADGSAATPSIVPGALLQRLAARQTWIFDLDNTLYPPEAGIMAQVNERMTQFIMRELSLDRGRANDIRSRYWRRYGITLEGLRRHHGVAPSRFLDEVHDLDLSHIKPDPALCEALTRLAGDRGTSRRLIVHTNGSRAHATRVLERLDLTETFAAVYAIEDKGLSPKPEPEAYDRVIAADGLDPLDAVMLEDTAANLAVPHRLDMVTLWVTQQSGPTPPQVDHVIPALVPFLRAIT